MNTSPIQKLTLVSITFSGKRYSAFVMAQYDQNGRAHVSERVLAYLIGKAGAAGHCIGIG